MLANQTDSRLILKEKTGEEMIIYREFRRGSKFWSIPTIFHLYLEVLFLWSFFREIFAPNEWTLNFCIYDVFFRFKSVLFMREFWIFV